MKVRLRIISILIFLAQWICANDGSYNQIGHGGAVIPIKNNSITMEREEIKIILTETEFGFHTINFDCTFHFKNTTSDQQKVLIGFPHKLDSHFSPEDSDEGLTFVPKPSGSAVNDFTFFINGIKTDYREFQPELNPKFKQIPAYDVVYGVEQFFLPGEEKIIRNTYSMSEKYSEYPIPHIGNHTEGLNKIYYILKSGLSWKGPIRQADITITFQTLDDFFTITSAKPAGFKRLTNGLQYQFRNFIPSEDINIVFKHKKIGIGPAVKQIKECFDKADFLNAYNLLMKWDVTTLEDTKDNKTKDIIRNLAYATAEKFYKKDWDKVINLYEVCLRHCYSYKPDQYYDIFMSFSKDFLENKMYSKWIHEGESNSPCYYIAYNLACSYSLSNKADYEISISKDWYDIAIQMNPELVAMAEKDKDLENLFKKINERGKQ